MSCENETNEEKLKRISKDVNWKTKSDIEKFFLEFQELIIDCRGGIPNLQDFFRKQDMDLILLYMVQRDYDLVEKERLIEDIAGSGYKDVPEVDENGRPLSRCTTALHYIAKQGLAINVYNLLKIYDRFDVNYADESGLTHLHVACKYGWSEVVEKFLEHGQDPDCLWLETGDSPLHLAMSKLNPKLIELLLRKGANPNLANKDGATPLHIVSKSSRSRYDLEKFFKINDELKQTLQVNARDNRYQTPLHYAVTNNCAKMIAVLLRGGADPTLSNSDGRTPLHCIVNDFSDKEDLVHTILDLSHKQVQIDARDNFGWTPLQLAVIRGCRKVMESLLRNGADPNSIVEMKQIELPKKKLKLENEPLHCNQRKGSQLLVNKDPDPILANYDGMTPLHIICKRGEPDIMTLFVKINDEMQQTLQVNVRDSSGRTPLDLAVEHLLPHVVDVLLDRGADLSSFVFPPIKVFHERLQYRREFRRDKMHSKLELTCDSLAVVEVLDKAGYPLDINVSTKIMMFCAMHGSFEAAFNLEKSLFDDKQFVSKAKRMKIGSSRTLDYFARLPPDEVEARLTCIDFSRFLQSNRISIDPEGPIRTCTRYLFAILLRKFFRQCALECFWVLMRRRLTLSCCDMVLRNLTYKDLRRICLAVVRSKPQ